MLEALSFCYANMEAKCAEAHRSGLENQSTPLFLADLYFLQKYSKPAI